MGTLNECFEDFWNSNLEAIVTWDRSCGKGLDQAGLSTHSIHTQSPDLCLSRAVLYVCNCPAVCKEQDKGLAGAGWGGVPPEESSHCQSSWEEVCPGAEAGDSGYGCLGSLSVCLSVSLSLSLREDILQEPHRWS